MNITIDTRASSAATPPAAERFDLYAPIHKALRLFMTDTLARVSRVDVDDATDLHAALDEVDALLGLARSHLQHENDFVHPAIEARLPGETQRVAAEHLEHVQAIAGLADEVDELRAAAPVQRGRLAQRLYRQLALFIADNLQHMHVEETAHNGALWSCYSDAELRALDQHIESHVPPEEGMVWMRWIARSATPQHLTGLLGTAQKLAPPEAFAAALAVVRAQLDEARWARLAGVLHLPQVAGLVAFR